jgi:sialidase-1
MLALSATAVLLLAALQSTTGSSSADGCRWDGIGHDFFSHNESNSLGTTASGSNEREMDTSCCRQCRARPGCTFWVRSTTNNHCWLKSNFSHFGVNPQRRGNFLGSLPPVPPPPPLPTNPTQVTVFEAGMGGFTCFRIPSIVLTANKTLLAFAEARVESCADHNAAAIAMRRSTDHGHSWSAFQVVDGNSSTRRGTPSAVPLDSGEVFLTYVKWPFDPVRFGVGLRKSTGGSGNDWTAESDLYAELRSASPDAGRISPSPDSGLQLRSDPARLLIPFHNAVVLSTDSGRTWQVAHSFVASEVRESAVADLGGGEVLLNARSMNHEVKQGRAVSRSTDGGLHWSNVTFDHALVGTNCQGSIAAFDGVVYVSYQDSKVERAQLTIKRSTSGGRNWSSSLLVQPGRSAGYSSLVKGTVRDDAHGGILFEMADGPAVGNIAFALYELGF